MATPNIKNREALIEAIRHLEDEELIEYMLEMVRSYARDGADESSSSADWWDELSPEQQQRLDSSIAAADRGEFVDNDEVMNGL